MSDGLRIGVAGFGMIGQVYARHLLDDPRVKSLYICNTRRLQQAGEVAAAIYPDVPTMLDRASLDAVCICTPHDMHRGAVEAVAPTGLPMLLEKPMAGTLEDCDAILDAVRAGGNTIVMAHSLRYDEAYRQAGQLIHAGAIGEPVFLSGQYLAYKDYADYPRWKVEQARAYGGVLIRDAVHIVDMLRWYVNRQAESVWGERANLRFDAEVEDTFVGVIRFQGPTLAQIAGASVAQGFSDVGITVYGNEGALRVGVGRLLVHEPSATDPRALPIGSTDFYRHQMRHFIDCVIGADEPLVTVQEARETMRLILALYASAAAGRQITL
jgi:UDP-N-acetyl-2-amino-2-deoxyglucuronate dehydrogenase